jgi:hypothetical protein
MANKRGTCKPGVEFDDMEMGVKNVQHVGHMGAEGALADIPVICKKRPLAVLVKPVEKPDEVHGLEMRRCKCLRRERGPDQ